MAQETGQVFTRKMVVALLSQERGRSPDHQLDSTLISRWCADLGFELRLRLFTADQFAQLRAVNRHYARGGSRVELLAKMRRKEWYKSKI
jgi:hypothetical protein